MAACRAVVGIVLIVIIGAFMIACSAVLIPYLVERQVKQNVVLKNDSEGYKAWLTPEAPIYIDFYFFNVTNSQQFTQNWSVKPHVKQIGPYVYREIRNKTDVDFKNAGDTLRYREHKWYVFERNMSCGDENDTFTTINLPLLTVATDMRFDLPLHQYLVKYLFLFLQQQLFEQYTVHELLWGYNLTFPSYVPAELAEKMNELIKQYNGNSTEFGIYVGRTANGTDDGIHEINTGVDDVSKLGLTNSWNGNRTLPYWSDSYCNMINGTDGTMWHPFISDQERLYVFTSDLCRSVYVTCDNCHGNLNASSVVIPIYRFKPPAAVFAAPATNPDNRGFCTPDCMEAGVLNVSNCRNAPIVMSQPHFYQAAKKYQDAIDGLSPSADCQTFLDVEPTTGIVLNAARKVQVNAYLRKLIALRETNNMEVNNSIVFPILWLSEHAKMGEGEANKFYHEVLKPISTAWIVKYLLYAVGGVMLLVAVVWIVVLIIRHKRQNPFNVQSRSRAADETDDDDARLIDAGSA